LWLCFAKLYVATVDALHPPPALIAQSVLAVETFPAGIRWQPLMPVAKMPASVE
jgi:hypothetical protein